MIELEIPPRSAYVGVVRLAIAALARGAGLDEEAVDDLRIAVSEACANAVLANEEAGSDDPVQVTWTQGDDHLAIEVADRGTIYLTENDEDSQGFSSRLALSVGLLESLVDECEFRPREGGGTSARLLVRL